MSKILLILGSGPRIGQAVFTKFTAAGYKVATASRTAKDTDTTKDNHVHFTIDLADPSAVERLFAKVTKLWGAPSVVVYNAASHIPTPQGLLSVPVADFAKSLNINTVSAFAAASSALALNPSVAFFYTGNVTNTQPLPGFGVSGVGKVSSACWIKEAAQAGGGARFYYVDQHLQDGSPAYGKVSGDAHADLFLRLADQKKQEEPLLVFKA